MYTTKEKIENYLMTNIDSSFDTQITNWISAAQLYINNYVGKSDGFEETVESIKYYDGNGERELDIDECIEITSIEILESNGTDVEYTLSEGQENDYITWPYNELPIYRLRLTNVAEVGSFNKGKKRIKITAKWGHSSTVPKDVELVATILTSSAIEPGLKGGKIKSEKLGDYSVAFEMMEDSPNILSTLRILDHYKTFKL